MAGLQLIVLRTYLLSKIALHFRVRYQLIA